MALNKIFDEANHISVPLPVGTQSGDPVRIGGAGGFNAVAVTNVSTADVDDVNVPDGAVSGFNDTGYGSVDCTGGWAFMLDGGAALEIGDPVFIDPTDNSLADASAADLALFGHKIGMTKGGHTIVRIATTGAVVA